MCGIMPNRSKNGPDHLLRVVLWLIFFGQRVAVNAQTLAAVRIRLPLFLRRTSAMKHLSKLLRRFGEEDAFLDHFPAEILQALLEPERRFDLDCRS